MKGLTRAVLEALVFGTLALIPLTLIAVATRTLTPTMKVTITFTDPPGGTATYTEVTSYSNDGKVMKLTGKNAAGEVVTVEYNWAFIISVTIVNTG